MGGLLLFFPQITMITTPATKVIYHSKPVITVEGYKCKSYPRVDIQEDMEKPWFPSSQWIFNARTVNVYRKVHVQIVQGEGIYNVRPPSYVYWFISPSNYSYKYHKP